MLSKFDEEQKYTFEDSLLLIIHVKQPKTWTKACQDNKL